MQSWTNESKLCGRKMKRLSRDTRFVLLGLTHKHTKCLRHVFYVIRALIFSRIITANESVIPHQLFSFNCDHFLTLLESNTLLLQSTTLI